MNTGRSPVAPGADPLPRSHRSDRPQDDTGGRIALGYGRGVAGVGAKSTPNRAPRSTASRNKPICAAGGGAMPPPTRPPRPRGGGEAGTPPAPRATRTSPPAPGRHGRRWIAGRRVGVSAR